MAGHLRLQRIAIAAAIATLFSMTTAVPVRAAFSGADHLRGRLLTEALRLLQRQGLAIVFSSELVTRDMRVETEPRSSEPRQQLDEILATHGLVAVPGPGAVVQIVRAPRPTRSIASAGTRARAPVAATDATLPSHTERVEVHAPSSERVDPAGEMGLVVSRESGTRAIGSAADTPGVASRTMPGVSASDDFRDEFSVRGSAYRHVATVIDGVPTPWLRHTIRGRDVGSLSMFGLDGVERLTLRAGAYPRRDADSLDAELAITLREGARDATRVQGFIGATNGSGVAEGPIGRAARGSWIASGRQSLLAWPLRRLSQPGVGVGFVDAQAKLAYDVNPRQTVTAVVIAGRSVVDEPDDTAALALAAGTNRAWFASFGWRSLMGAATTLAQRTWIVDHRFLSAPRAELATRDGVDRVLGYRAALTHLAKGVLLEGGSEVQSQRSTRRLGDEAVADHWFSRALYVTAERDVARRLSLHAGARVSASSLVTGHPVSRWLGLEWRVSPRWYANATTGVSHQLPDPEQVRRLANGVAARAERAAAFDLSLEHRVTTAFRWRVTAYDRAERDVYGELDPWSRDTVAGPAFAAPAAADVLRSARSRGAQLLTTFAAADRVVARASYSYGITHARMGATGDAFRGDFDQRHTVNVVTRLRMGDRSSLVAQFRALSNLPIPGAYAEARGDTLLPGDRRNTLQLPAYARLDLRLQRRFRALGRDITLFGEIVNVLNRTNRALAADAIVAPDGRVAGYLRSLTPRRPLAGCVIVF